MRGWRGQARPNRTPSAQLTWLATTSAPPWAGHFPALPPARRYMHVDHQLHGQPRGLERQQPDDDHRDRHGDDPADQKDRRRRKPQRAGQQPVDARGAQHAGEREEVVGRHDRAARFHRAAVLDERLQGNVVQARRSCPSPRGRRSSCRSRRRRDVRRRRRARWPAAWTSAAMPSPPSGTSPNSTLPRETVPASSAPPPMPRVSTASSGPTYCWVTNRCFVAN